MFPPPPLTPRPNSSQRSSSHPRPHPRPHLPPRLPSPPSILTPQLPPPPHHHILSTSSTSNKQPYQPYYLPSPPHATPHLTQPHHPPLYAAQTQNVLTVALPTEGNSAWSFPVNVIPYVNASSASGAAGSAAGGGTSLHPSELHNPLIVPSITSPTNRVAAAARGRFNDNSRAASVLGNTAAGYGRAALTSMSSSSLAAAGERHQSMYSHHQTNNKTSTLPLYLTS